MTKKRFVNKGKDIFQYGEWWCGAGGEHCADVIATAINELLEENEQLKKSVKRQQDSNNECAKLIQEQQKENEQLKADKQSLIDFIKKEFPKSHKHILEGFE